MDAMRIYGDIVALCEDTGTCPHGVLSHVADVDGMATLTEGLIVAISDGMSAFVNGNDDGTELGNMLSHALILMAGVGYAVGSEHAYDVVLSSDIVVPDDLASMDWLESTGMDGQGGQ